MNASEVAGAQHTVKFPLMKALTWKETVLFLSVPQDLSVIHEKKRWA